MRTHVRALGVFVGFLFAAGCDASGMSDGNNARLTVTATAAEEGYFVIDKALYSWQELDRIDELVRAHHMTRVHVYVGSSSATGPGLLTSDPQRFVTANAKLR